MKQRYIFILSFIALIGLVVVQGYVVNELYRLKSKEFDNLYGGHVYRAMEYIDAEIDFQPLDSVFVNLNVLAYEIFEQSAEFDIVQGDDKIKSRIVDSFENIVSEHEQITPFLREYLASYNLDPDFNSGFHVRELSLIDKGEKYQIYKSRKKIEHNEESRFVSASSMFARSLIYEMDNYSFVIDFYIDFTHKKMIILNEMKGILLLITFVMIVIMAAFISTLRNMMKQKKLSDIKTDFINNMTHELKTPLSTIAVASSSLTVEKIQQDREKTKMLSGIIKKQNRHLTQMIDHILDISVIDRNEFNLNKEEVEVIPFIQEIAEAFRVEYKDSKVNLVEEYVPGPFSTLELDAFQMTRVINNLLSNAVKYCDEDPRIIIRVIIDVDLVIEVADNGIGIRKEDLREIFTKFYRCNHEHKLKVKGLGLGLYFVRNIIAAHGGNIMVQSVPNNGTTFKISIPRKISES
ncbi:HAMP domain-containing histidine kinase [Puteibacter caeruleilacunae]|nr:HAMP domain-containing histidine kinase [Puteibacter caeruleilacunae]